MQHQERANGIINQLGSEYAAWFGWSQGFGKYVALGEYILELTEENPGADEWLVTAGKAFRVWKARHGVTQVPPRSPNAE